MVNSRLEKLACRLIVGVTVVISVTNSAYASTIPSLPVLADASYYYSTALASIPTPHYGSGSTMSQWSYQFASQSLPFQAVVSSQVSPNGPALYNSASTNANWDLYNNYQGGYWGYSEAIYEVEIVGPSTTPQPVSVNVSAEGWVKYTPLTIGPQAYFASPSKLFGISELMISAERAVAGMGQQIFDKCATSTGVACWLGNSVGPSFGGTNSFEMWTNIPYRVDMRSMAEIDQWGFGTLESYLDPTFNLDQNLLDAGYKLVISPGVNQLSRSPNSVPEPNAMALTALGLALAGVGVARRKFPKKQGAGGSVFAVHGPLQSAP